MIVLAFVRTFAIAAPIEPVVSDKKTMSGFGGIGGVWTVFVIVTLEPDASAAGNEGGLTPVPAEAGAASMRDVSALDATPSPRIRFLIRFLSLLRGPSKQANIPDSPAGPAAPFRPDQRHAVACLAFMGTELVFGFQIHQPQEELGGHGFACSARYCEYRQSAAASALLPCSTAWPGSPSTSAGVALSA